jgi:hypothetical protein
MVLHVLTEARRTGRAVIVLDSVTPRRRLICSSGLTIRVFIRQAPGERKDFVGKLQEGFYNFSLRLAVSGGKRAGLNQIRSNPMGESGGRASANFCFCGGWLGGLGWLRGLGGSGRAGRDFAGGAGRMDIRRR